MKPYRILPASGEPAGIVASIPHTGTWLPDEVRARLAPGMESLPMTDWHLHALYDFLPALGVTVVHATVSRFAVDLNRSPAPLELYPGRLETSVVPRETFWGDPVFSDPPDERDTALWIARYHRPYHQVLERELFRCHDRLGHAVLLDLHSVASRASLIHPALGYEIYLGDRDGTSCSAALTDHVGRIYEEAGFAVTRNDPYKGGYITHRYGQMEGIEALQIEMVQKVYMDEDAPDGAPGDPLFDQARKRLHAVFSGLVETIGSRAGIARDPGV